MKRAANDEDRDGLGTQMKRHWIELQPDRPTSPMTRWVRGEQGDSRVLVDTGRQVGGQFAGYPLFKVEYQGFAFEFASLEEMRECIEVLGTKLLPRTLDLAREKGTGAGPNSHWLSRLPGHVKPWRYRKGAIAYLRAALVDFERQISEAQRG